MSKMFIPPFCINCISHTFLSCQMTVRMGLKVNITRINGLYEQKSTERDYVTHLLHKIMKSIVIDCGKTFIQ